jgi:predicted nucleotidyltransferase
MLKERILSTLRFFDLQDWPPTLLELHTFLIANINTLKSQLDERFEIVQDFLSDQNQTLPIDQLMRLLEVDCQPEVESFRGFYYLKGRKKIVEERLQNYLYGIKRERLITKFIGGLKHIPFVRGVALAGSQAMGQQRKNSDIDLLIITDPNFLWLARFFVSAYFQISGKRRHGKIIANRFCLNHYLSKPKEVDQEKNLYKAMEYAKLRPLLYPQVITEFQNNNSKWIKMFFPNVEIQNSPVEPQTSIQRALEFLFSNRFGFWLEKILKKWGQKRIKQGEYVFVTEEELSFHPDSKHGQLLDSFFKIQ